MRRLLVLYVLATAISGWSQGVESAQQIYRESSDSVFLVYLNDSSGKPTALGTAFLVAPRTLITNAHVVEAGVPVIAVGPVRIPCKVIRKDERNDLALIQVDADLTSVPLKLAHGDMLPGQRVFAIGNPKGLEKSISEGIVSGIRNEDGRSLIQITSPISHGSSGGPILNPGGEVVGVAVSFLEGGENLNFAVPVRYVEELIERKGDPMTPPTLVDANQVEAISSQRSAIEYSDDPASNYQRATTKLIEAMRNALPTVADAPGLRKLTCVGVANSELVNDGITSATKLARLSSDARDRALLPYVIYQRASNSYLVGLFAKDGSPEKQTALDDQRAWLEKAEVAATAVRQSALGRRELLAAYVLASVHEDRSEFDKAIPLFEEVFSGKLSVCGNDLTLSALRSLITDSNGLKRPAEAEKWFRLLARDYQPSPYDWDSEGDRRADEKDYAATADAYERAAAGANGLKVDACYATSNRSLSPGNNEDAILRDGRLCIDAAAVNTNKNKNAEFERVLPLVHRLIGGVLEERGVHEAALAEVKESLSEKPADPWSLLLEADIFASMERFTECISAASGAVQGTDGKYSEMHFRLGYCYSKSNNPARAEESYRHAAQIDLKDPVSAYNLALTLKSQGYLADARHWFEESLKRNPDAELRAQIMSAMPR